MNTGTLLDDLARSIEYEIAALDAGDHETLALATRAKLAVLEAVRHARPDPLPHEMLAKVIELNRAAAARVNRARARIERRLGVLARAAGNDPPCAYGSDGRPVKRFREELPSFIPQRLRTILTPSSNRDQSALLGISRPIKSISGYILK